MSRARDLSNLGNINSLAVDTADNEVGIASTAPRSTLDVRGELQVGTGIQVGSAGVVTATSFSGSGANLTGLATTETVRTDTITVAGVSTFTGAINADATTDSTSVTTGALIVDGGVGIAKNVYIGAGLSVAGTLTYEDVTNVDSVGLITAKSGVNVSGGQLQVGVAYSVGAAGIVTAAGGSFTGDVDIADKIVHTGDTNTAIRFPAADTVSVETGGTESFRVDSSQRLLKGLTSSRGNYGNNTSGVDYGLQVEGLNAVNSTIALVRNSNDANDGGIVLGKTRATSVGGNTVVQAGDDLGTITWAGSDGTSLQFGAEIFAEVQTGVGNDDLPTDLIVKTNGGSTSTSERLRITSAGQLLVGTATTNETNETLVVHQSTAFVDNIVSLETAEGKSNYITFRDDDQGVTAQIRAYGGAYGSGFDNALEFLTSSSSNNDPGRRVVIKEGGDVEIAGNAVGVTSAYWDASANSFIFNDTSYAKFGSGSDLSIYHDGSDSYVDQSGSGNLYIRGNGSNYIRLQPKTGEDGIRIIPDAEVQIYYNNSKKFETTNEGVEVTGFTSTTAGMGVTGGLFEGSFIKAGKLSDNKTLGISTSNVFFFTTQESTTATPNIVWDDTYSLSSKMAVGDVASVTVITTAAAGGYSANWTIDGNAVTEEWVGGSAPSAGGDDGLDIYSLTIIKTGTGTGDSGFKLIGNLTNATN